MRFYAPRHEIVAAHYPYREGWSVTATLPTGRSRPSFRNPVCPGLKPGPGGGPRYATACHQPASTDGSISVSSRIVRALQPNAKTRGRRSLGSIKWNEVIGHAGGIVPKESNMSDPAKALRHAETFWVAAHRRRSARSEHRRGRPGRPPCHAAHRTAPKQNRLSRRRVDPATRLSGATT